MKKIAILTCLDSISGSCTGAACIEALNRRTGAFLQYQDMDVELEAFFQCSGCGKDEQAVQDKVNRILKIHPDAVHLGVCTIKKDMGRCKTIEKMAKIFMENGIEVINGTHNSSKLSDIGMPITL